jgi:hypothetical protein
MSELPIIILLMFLWMGAKIYTLEQRIKDLENKK